MSWLLIQEKCPPVAYDDPSEALNAALALDSVNARSVLVGVREDGTRAEAIIATGGMETREARRLAGVS